MTTQAQLAALGVHRVQPDTGFSRTAVAELAAAVAHEVNNPLTAVLGFAELLLADLPRDGRGRHELETIRDEAIRARGVIRALVDFARPGVLDLAPTDLNAVIGAALDALRERLEGAGVVVQATYGALPLQPLDAGAIGRAVVPLVENAVHACDEGILRVATRLDGDAAVLTIAGGGVADIGEPASTRTMGPFFVPGYRAVGHGLGLPTAVAIIEAHGGSIGRSGSLVRICLPLRPPTAESGPSSGPVQR